MTYYLDYPQWRRLARRHPLARMMNEDWMDESTLSTPMDVKASEDAYEVKLTLPGVEAEDINIQAVNDTLTVQGEMKSDFEENANYMLRERVCGKFLRSVRFPETINSAKVEANLKDGILTIHVPKAEEARPKTIKVAVGTGTKVIDAGKPAEKPAGKNVKAK